ncbi:MAG: YciI family protein [Pseudomonadota bacterium]
MNKYCHYRRFAVIGTLLALAYVSLHALQIGRVAAADEAQKTLFAVEINVGPNWDDAKSPNQQAFFREHSANLKRLRDAGHIVLGARYADIGLIVFSATSAEEVRAFMADDPAMAAGTFKYDVHRFSVFYPGLVQP